MKCTIKQLAEELELSRNTVSKALKNSSEVSSKTKQTVLSKARELGYKNIDESLLNSEAEDNEESPPGPTRRIQNSGPPCWQASSLFYPPHTTI